MIIQRNPNPSGAYPAPQTWASPNIPTDYVQIADSVDMADFYAYNGFVTLTIEQVASGTTPTINEEGQEVEEVTYTEEVTAYTPNVEAWEAWKASLPEEEFVETPTEME